jgi:hypothetical protein
LDKGNTSGSGRDDAERKLAIKWRRDNNLCFQCGEPGHQTSSCQEQPGTNLARDADKQRYAGNKAAPNNGKGKEKANRK